MKKAWFLATGPLGVVVLLLAGMGGCSRPPAGGKSSLPGSAAGPSGSSPTSPVGSEAGSAGKELADVLKKRTALTSYEMTMTVDGKTKVQQVVQLKNGEIVRMKVKTGEEGDWMLALLDKKEFYMYSAKDNSVMKMPQAEEGTEDPAALAGKYSQAPAVPDLKELQKQSPLVEADTVDGVPCWRVDTPGAPPGKAQVWFDQQYGLPVQTKMGDMLLKYEYKRINTVPDSEFELPPGVQVMDMGNIRKGLPQMPENPPAPGS